MVVNGGALRAKELELLLKAPYDNEMVDIKANGDRFFIDDELSNETTKVFQKEGTEEIFVVHSGSKDMRDVLENYNYITKGFYNSHKLNQAKDTQQKAEEKYGAKNISTLGHSKGGKYAEMLGKNTKEIITLNKPVHITDLFTKVPKKQTDIKSTYDPVSFLRRLQRGNKPVIIKSETSNPLEEHKGKILQRKPNKIYGRGNTIVRVAPTEMTSVVVPERQEEETEDETDETEETDESESETDESETDDEEIRIRIPRRGVISNVEFLNQQLDVIADSASNLYEIISRLYFNSELNEDELEEIEDLYKTFIYRFSALMRTEDNPLFKYLYKRSLNTIRNDIVNLVENNINEIITFFNNNNNTDNTAYFLRFILQKLNEMGI